MTRRTLTRDEIAANIERRELGQLCANVAFQKLLLRILKNASIFTAHSQDPTVAASQEGRRALGLDIMRWVEDAAPGNLAKVFVTHGLPWYFQPQPQEEPNERDADPDAESE